MVKRKMTCKEIISEYDSDYDDYCSGKRVADIAEERGVSCQTIYRYFRVVAEYYSDSLHQKRGRKPKDISKTIIRYCKNRQVKQFRRNVDCVAVYVGRSDGRH